MKLYKLLTENTVTPVDKKMVSVLQRMKVDPNEIKDIWNKLNDPLAIADIDLKIKIAFLYTQSCYINDEDNEFGDEGDIVCNDLEDVDWGEMTNTIMVDDDQLALAEWIEIPPFLLQRQPYQHYGLNTYEFDGEEYSVGDDPDVEDAMYQYAEQVIEYELDMMDEWWLSEYLSLNDWAVDQFCEEEADHRLDNMDEQEMMQEANMDPEEKQDEIDTWEGEKDDKESEMVDLQYELDELDDQRGEVEGDEFDEIDEEYGNKEEEISEKEYEIESLEEDIKEAQEELRNMPEEAKDQLRESYVEDLKDSIESEGVEYFTSNLGMSRADAVDYYFDFDDAGAKQALADEQDRGETISGYDGTEEEQEYDGETYYIYRQA